MKIEVKHGGLYYQDEWIEPIIADAIALRNGKMYAEQIVEAYAGKTLEVDPVSMKIIKVED